jgi:hypothetical protein
MFAHATLLHSQVAKQTLLSQQTSQHAVFTLTTLRWLSTLIHQKSTKLSFTVRAVLLVPVLKAQSSQWLLKTCVVM